MVASSCCTPKREEPCVQQGVVTFNSGANFNYPDIVWLEGGRSYCGTRNVLIKADGEERRDIKLRPFGIDRFAVTNARFASFVEATGFQTEAEAFGWSFVFKDALDAETRANSQRVVEVPWWYKIDGAYWRQPAGLGSNVDRLPDHPVVHISWNDAAAFASWSGGRLLTEGEWEFAARGGRDTVYPWGDDDPPDHAPRCNIWQGRFPERHLAERPVGTVPVDAFEPNGYDLFNMAGNAWEWCAEPFRVKSLSSAGKARDATARRDSERLLKGGSFLCHRSYCHRYRIAARMGRPPDSATSHMGFRLGYDPV